MRLDLVPVTPFSKQFRVRDGERVIGEVTLGGSGGTKARIVIDDAVHEVRKDRSDGAMLLVSGALPEAQAVRERFWKPIYDVERPGERLRFGRLTDDERTFEAERGGRRLATVRKPTFWSRAVVADVPDEWPLPFALFVATLALFAWQS